MQLVILIATVLLALGAALGTAAILLSLIFRLITKML
jgi:hypothetical protein